MIRGWTGSGDGCVSGIPLYRRDSRPWPLRLPTGTRGNWKLPDAGRGAPTLPCRLCRRATWSGCGAGGRAAAIISSLFWPVAGAERGYPVRDTEVAGPGNEGALGQVEAFGSLPTTGLAFLVCSLFHPRVFVLGNGTVVSNACGAAEPGREPSTVGCGPDEAGVYSVADDCAVPDKWCGLGRSGVIFVVAGPSDTCELVAREGVPTGDTSYISSSSSTGT